MIPSDSLRHEILEYSLNKYIIAFLFTGLLILSSCRTVKYVEVPVETVKTEYKVQKDSVYLHDSINVYTEVKGDTVYITKYKYRLKESCTVDTFIKRDSIPVIVKVRTVVEVNKLKLW